jgi:hypothetical protein
MQCLSIFGQIGIVSKLALSECVKGARGLDEGLENDNEGFSD